MLPIKFSCDQFFCGAITLAPAAERLTTISRQLKRGVIVYCRTDKIWVGPNSGLTEANGYELSSGSSVEIFIDDPNKIWIRGQAPGTKAKWIAV